MLEDYTSTPVIYYDGPDEDRPENIKTAKAFLRKIKHCGLPMPFGVYREILPDGTKIEAKSNQQFDPSMKFKHSNAVDVVRISVPVAQKKQEANEKKGPRDVKLWGDAENQFVIPAINAYHDERIWSDTAKSAYYVAHNFLTDPSEHILRYVKPDKDGKAQTYFYLESPTEIFSELLMELEDVGVELTTHFNFDDKWTTLGYEPPFPGFPPYFECWYCGGFRCKELTGWVGDNLTLYRGATCLTDATIAYWFYHELLIYIDGEWIPRDYYIGGNTWWGSSRINITVNGVASYQTSIVSINGASIREFPALTVTAENKSWGEACTYFASGEDRSTTIEGVDCSLLGGSLWEDKGRYIYIWGQYDYSGTYTESDSSSDMSHFFRDGYSGIGFTWPETESIAMQVYLATDEIEDYLLLETTTDDSCYCPSVKIYDFNDDPVYMYSLFSENLAIMLYGFIFKGEHHRLLFESVDAENSRHSFSNATYIGPDGITKSVEFPDKFEGLHGDGFFVADSLFLSKKFLQLNPSWEENEL